MKLTKKKIKEFEENQKKEGTKWALILFLDRLYDPLFDEVMDRLSVVSSEIDDIFHKNVVLE